MTTTTYEFTAFTEADLLDAGADGYGVNCGDTFTMSGTATTCFEVSDNDAFLSGDNYCNENANDQYGQQAAITDAATGAEIGNGGQIYAEKYFWVYDDAGNWYVMLQIEQEGTGEEYFTFFNGYGYETPAEGTNLTVYSSCNVTSDWVDYKCLDAGDKGPDTGSISGTVFCDVDCDGVQDGETTVTKGDNIFTDSVTFESVACTTYNVDSYGAWYSVGADVIDLVVGGAQGHNGNANDNTIVELDQGGVWCRQFSVEDSGTYCLQLDVYKNSCVGDQGNTFLIKINGVTVEEVTVTEDGKIEVSLDLLAGDNRIDFVSASNVYGYGAGIDNIELLPLIETTTVTEPGKEGVVVVLLDANGDEVLDDNGDRIETVTDANGDYQFDDVPVGDYRVKFENPDGTEFTFQNVGDDDTIDSDADANGVSDVVSVTASETTSDVDAGLKPVSLGSLSGRYFSDADRDGLDNDGANGISDIQVELLDENGVGLGIFETTDADGNYSFGDLAAGTYGVKFTDPDTGRELTTQNVDMDASDDIDSDAADAGNGMSTINDIVVVAGADTPDNDAGVVELLGSLSGRYFCDDDGDGLDNDGDTGGEGPGVAGVRVDLLDANGDETGRSTTTDSQGNYSFANLVAGSYGVRFADGVLDKVLTTQNVDNDVSDDIDSDAMGDDLGFAAITNIAVLPGQNTPDNDIGVTPDTNPPEAEDVQAAVCADDTATINLLNAVSDPDGDAVSITSISDADEIAGVGGSITLEGGGVATLNMDGTVSFNPNGAYDDLVFGESELDQFQYTASDGVGEVTANADISIKGATDTLEKIEAALGELNVTGALSSDDSIGGDIFGFDFTSFEDPTDPFAQRLDAVAGGGEIDFAFCLSIATPIPLTPLTNDFTVGVLDEASYLEAMEGAVDVGDFPTGPGSDDGGFNDENIDNVNWLLNEAEALLAEGFTQGNIQRAIWNLVDGGENDVLEGQAATFFFSQNPEFQTPEAALELTNRALNDGEGFVAGTGDKVGLILDPVEDGVQPLVIAVEFDTLVFDCLC